MFQSLVPAVTTQGKRRREGGSAGWPSARTPAVPPLVPVRPMASRTLPRRVAVTAWLLAVAVLLSGCVYLRLLALQKQLANFDRYVDVSETGDLTLTFRKPVLYAEDIRWLIELNPTSTTGNSGDQTWHWTFAKERAATNHETGNFDLTFATAFTSNKMSQFILSERFLMFMPKPLILGFFKSMGHAEVDQKKRSAKAKWRGPGLKDVPMPTQREVGQLLGQPLSVQEEGDQSIHLYKYMLKTSTPVAARKKEAWAKFYFARTNAQLAQVESDFAGFKIKLAFDPSQDQRPPQSNSGSSRPGHRD
jgi:hypothetical protein